MRVDSYLQQGFAQGMRASVVGLCLFAIGCSSQSYPAGHLKASLQEICEKEYGISDIDVKINGNTLGVYLPLNDLFVNNFKEKLSGKKSSGSLFEPTPEALDKVEDVLFSISRVILSTDEDIDFYVLQATDVKNTGLQLILKGYVNDIKRVRVWDIPRSEYRKRVIHELRLNQTVIWHRPIRSFFRDLSRLDTKSIAKRYFQKTLDREVIDSQFLRLLPDSIIPEQVKQWELLEIKSTELNQKSAVVYVKVQPRSDYAEMRFDKLEYLFIVGMDKAQVKIMRVIPFQFPNEQGQLEKIDFPEELQINKNLSKWRGEFQLDSIHIGIFLAQQLTRRLQNILVADERIRSTIRDPKLEFEYIEDPEQSYFTLNVDARLRDFNHYGSESVIAHEDMHYLLGLASREFVNVLRGYSFSLYEHLLLDVVQDPTPMILGRNHLELFRKNKIDLKDLLSSSFINI